MATPKPLPDVAEFNKLLSYDPLTGRLTWKITKGRIKAGSVAGSKNRGYLLVKINGRSYRAHRICWILFYGEDPGDVTIDHVNRVRDDNRISNLRLATYKEQAVNRNLPVSNTTGHVGVYFCKRDNKWYAQIKDPKRRHLGYFKTFEEAVAARLQAEREHAIFIHDGLRHS